MSVSNDTTAIRLALDLLRLAAEPSEHGLGERSGERVVFPIVAQQPLVDGEQTVSNLIICIGAVLKVRHD